MKKDREEHLSIKQKRTVTAIIVFLLLLFAAYVSYFIGRPMIKFVSQPEKFRLWVDSHGIWSRFAFVGMVIFQVVIALIPGEPLEIGAGYAFGAIEGTLLCIIGLTIGGIIVFALVRTLGIRMVSVFFSLEKIRSVKFLQNTKRLNTIAFLVFFLPGTPKDLLSYFAGLTEIKWQYWLFLTSFARLPSIITSTVGGDALGVKKYALAAVVFGITLIISIVGLLIYKKISKQNKK